MPTVGSRRRAFAAGLFLVLPLVLLVGVYITGGGGGLAGGIADNAEDGDANGTVSVTTEPSDVDGEDDGGMARMVGKETNGRACEFVSRGIV